MHGGQHTMLPLLQLKEFDQYTTCHSLNVAVLSMALAEFLGLDPNAVRAFGVAGLLHDLGKIRIPIEILTKPGKLDADERALLNQHPVEGARIMLRAGERLEMASVVAYEHHIMLNGGGYPSMRFGRNCHQASRLVHVCDVYDALRTKRPYRDAWPAEQVLGYLEKNAGLEFDPEMVAPFVTMMRESESQVAVLTNEHEPIPTALNGEPEVASAADAGSL
jgi:putative nucleotidyltransferase with HDIG domain